MNTYQVTILLALGLCASLVISAPVEDAAGQTSTSSAAPVTDKADQVSPSTTTSTTAAPASAEQSTTSTSAKPEDDKSTTTNASYATGSMAVSSASDTPNMSNISFTCYGRTIGYYADEDLDCKVYHFCLLGEYNDEPVYQRISYICLNGTFFDQQALDCVETAKQTTPCKVSHQHYELSNKLLRQAIVGKHSHETQPKETQSAGSTTAAPADKPEPKAN